MLLAMHCSKECIFKL